MFEKFLEKLRGSSRAPDDLALGAVRPGDFADNPATPEHEGEGLAPNPHEDPADYQGRVSEQERESLAPDLESEADDDEAP
jgi:hypothetical protein